MEIVSLGLWIAGLFGKTPAMAAAKKIGTAAIVAGVVIVLGLAVWGGIAMHDKGVIEQYDQAKQAEQDRATLQADRKANEEIAVHASETAEENRELEQALSAAKAADPDKGQREVGPVTRSYFDKLRNKK